MNKIIEYLKFYLSSKKREKYPLQNISKFLAFIKKEKILPTFYELNGPGTEPETIIENKKCLMFSSNNYLGLSKNSSAIQAAKEGLDKHGLGPGGSRFLCGNIDVLLELDKKTAELVGFEDAITYPTGYMANIAIFESLMDPFIAGMPYKKGSGYIISDNFNHGSIVEGCKLSSAKKVIYKHNDLKDLEKKLSSLPKYKNKLLVTEGVFSPEGRLSPLPDIVGLAKKYRASVMVDDAHGIGVFGKNGGGTVQHFGLENEVDILMGSYDKALGGMGGFLAGKKELVEYLRIVSRPYVFSSAISGGMASGLLEIIRIVKSKEGQTLRKRLFDNTAYLREELRKRGFKILGDDKISVVPVLVGDEQKAILFANELYKEGVFLPSFRWPAVPKGMSRLRVTPMASHTRENLDVLVGAFEKVDKIIPIR